MRGKCLRMVTPQHPALFRNQPSRSQISGDEPEEAVCFMSIAPFRKHLVDLCYGSSPVFLLLSAVVEAEAGLNRWIS